jgi:hypothetical protein
MLLRIFVGLHGGVRVAQRVAEVDRIEQSEIRDRAARPAPDFVSLNPGYACLADFQDDRTRANVLFGLVGVTLNTVL